MADNCQRPDLNRRPSVNWVYSVTLRGLPRFFHPSVLRKDSTATSSSPGGLTSISGLIRYRFRLPSRVLVMYSALSKSSIILNVVRSVMPKIADTSLAVMRGCRAMWLKTKAWFVRNLNSGNLITSLYIFANHQRL